MLIGYKSHLAGYQFKTKEYSRNQVLLIQKGCVILHLNNQHLKLRAGHIIIFPKKCKFQMECIENYSGLFISNEQIQFKHTDPLIIKANQKFIFFYTLLEEEINNRNSDNTLKHQYANCILLNLSNKIPTQAIQKALVTSQDWAYRIKNILENNAYSSESTENILSHLELSYRQLSRCFQKEFKQSIKAFLINLRIKKAQEQLLLKSKSVSLIANELGFSSSQHLSLQFKKVIGIPPLEWLALQKN